MTLAPLRIWIFAVCGVVCLLVFGIFRKYISVYRTRLVSLGMLLCILVSAALSITAREASLV